MKPTTIGINRMYGDLAYLWPPFDAPIACDRGPSPMLPSLVIKGFHDRLLLSASSSWPRVRVVMDATDLLRKFFERLAIADERVLLLDYDGTLAPFQVDRDSAVPYPGIRTILGRILEAGHTRVVVISGRSTEDLLPLLGIKPHPEVWGTHGWERLMPDGTYFPAGIGAAAAEALDEAQRAIEDEGLGPHCERKPAGVALHWRGSDPAQVERLREIGRANWRHLCRDGALVLTEFDGGLELRVPGKDKGHAVSTVLDELSETAIVAYLGDDQTDEDAFKAIRGKGLAVLVRSENRDTAAEVRLTPPGELIDFLNRWHENARMTIERR
ncbi:trehalose-phosphatase [Candidatus Eisenbacteria bacterium]|uniref:Trehalose 6-phosphate phosphatase n=1 Tax=Eiseniibacteriota bacterium TaxID=2212470 RepID=A0ABV6YL95_UNCEI